jgi:hypothetical protein
MLSAPSVVGTNGTLTIRRALLMTNEEVLHKCQAYFEGRASFTEAIEAIDSIRRVPVTKTCVECGTPALYPLDECCRECYGKLK